MTYLTQLTVTSSYASAVLPALLILGLGFGMIFAPAINTATFGVARQDSGVASALVNTMQQVGGSIGTSALSTIALTATASYLITHHTSPLAPAIAATHGYTTAFAVSAALLGLGFILAIILLPSKRRLAELRNAIRHRSRPGTRRPCPAASIRSNSRGPVQLLAGRDPGSRTGGRDGSLTVTAARHPGRASRGRPGGTHASSVTIESKYAPNPNRRDSPAGDLLVDRIPPTPA